jgi:hypothetical protein
MASNSSGDSGSAQWGRSNGSSGHSMSSSSSIASSNAFLGIRFVPSVGGWVANGSTWGGVVLAGREGDQSSAPTTSTRYRCSPASRMGCMCYGTAFHDTLLSMSLVLSQAPMT